MNDALLVHFPSRLRHIRQKKGLTLQQLADKVGVSKNVLSMIERGLSKPSINTLLSIIDTLKVAPRDLFPSQVAKKHIVIQRSEEVSYTPQRVGKLRYADAEFYVPGFSTQEMNFARVKLSRDSFAPYITEILGDQIIYGLSGRFGYEYDGRVYEIGPGDALYYRGQFPRGPKEIYTQSAEYIIGFAEELFCWLEVTYDPRGIREHPPRAPQHLSRLEKIAWRIRYARNRKMMIQTDLGARAGLSKALVGHIESGRSTPSLSSLSRIAAALELPISYFLDEKSTMLQVSHSLAENRSTISRTEKGQTYEIEQLINPKFGLPMFESEVRVFTRKKFKPAMHRKKGQTYIQVLEGELEFTHRKQAIRLKKDDAIYFESNDTHGVTGIITPRAKILHCHSSLSKLL
jgi:transcriptional regulator with XRE-family HTH domain